MAGTHETPEGREVAAWFGRHVGKPQHPPYTAMGWRSNGEIKSCVLFTNYNGHNIEAHMFGRVTRQALREAFRYAFQTAKVVRVTALPYASNTVLCDALKRIGFVPEPTMNNYYGLGEDAQVMRLDPQAAERWMA